MSRRKLDFSEGKQNIISALLQGYDIWSAEYIIKQEVLLKYQ